MKLDLGCGTRKTPGFVGVDTRQFEGVDVVCDLSTQRWSFEDASVDEVVCSHMLEHIPGKSIKTVVNVDFVKHTVETKEVVTLPRSHFFNELARVMKKGARATITTPAWASGRACSSRRRSGWRWRSSTSASPVRSLCGPVPSWR